MDGPVLVKGPGGEMPAQARQAMPQVSAPPLHPARGDDDLMSQPQAPAADRGGSPWKDHIGRATRTWGRLSRVDLAIVDGDMTRLSALLHRHYVLTDNEIDQQIVAFLAGAPPATA